MNELSLQRWLLDQLKSVGGHGRKISNDLHSGIPDLIMTHNSMGTVLVEVKYIKDKLKHGFNRKVNVSPIQRAELLKFANAGMKVYLFVFYEYQDGDRYLVVMGPSKLGVNEVRITRSDQCLAVPKNKFQGIVELMRRAN